MLIRRELAADAALVDEVHRSAFGGSGGGDTEPVEVGLVRALRADIGWIPALALVAEDGSGAIVGHVVATQGRLGSVPVVGIGPLGVRAEWHGRGVGQALMHAVVAAADALEYPLAALLGDPRYYARFGFTPADRLGVQAPDPAWGEHFQARPLAAYRGEHGVFEYAPPFRTL